MTKERIADDEVERIKREVPIEELVAQRVKLRRRGASLQGLCPFHDEKTPSFTVSPAKQFYHCFGCGAHGTAISFLMEREGMKGMPMAPAR